jgi:hypothetical protein
MIAAMPAVRSSTGMPVTVRCSEELAQRLGLIPLHKLAHPWEPSRLVFWVMGSRPFPLFEKTFLWPAQPGLGAGLEDC